MNGGLIVYVDINVRSPKHFHETQTLPDRNAQVYKSVLEYAIVDEEIDMANAKFVLDNFKVDSQYPSTNFLREAIFSGKMSRI